VGNANKTYDSYTFTLGKEDTEWKTEKQP
jgi:hypothetical protein